MADDDSEDPPDDGEPDRKRAGKRPSDAIYEMAIGMVEDLLLQRLPWRQIVARLIEAGYARNEETPTKWRAEVRRRWALSDAEERPHRRDEHREMLRQLYHDAYVVQDYRCCEKIANQLMKLDGLNVPEVVKIEGSISVQAMAPQEREREIDALLARRAKAMQGLPEIPKGN